MKFTARLISIFILVSVIPIMVLAAFVFRIDQQLVDQQTTKSLTVMAELAESRVLSFFSEIDARVSDWSTDGYVRSETYSLGSSFDQAASTDLGNYILEKKMPLEPSIEYVEILGPDGRTIASSDQSRVGSTDEAGSPGFLAMIGAQSGVFFDARQEAIDQKYGVLMDFYSPIVSATDSRTVGVLEAHISVETLHDILTGAYQVALGGQTPALRQWQTLNLYILDRDGQVFSSATQSLTDIVGKVIDTKPVSACLQRGEEISGSYPNLDGVTVYGASMCPKNAGWVLLVEVSADEILKGLAGLKTVAYLIGLMILLAALTANLIIGGWYNKRLDDTRKAVERLGRGDFDVKLPPRGSDSWARLDQSINAAAGNLAKIMPERTVLAEAVRNSPVAVMIVENTPEMLISYVNSAWEELNGWRRSEVVGNRSPRILKSGKESEQFYQDFSRRLSLGEAVNTRVINKRKDGSTYDALASIFPIDFAGGTFKAYAAFYTIPELSEKLKPSRKRGT